MDDLLTGGPGSDDVNGGSATDYCTSEVLTDCELPRMSDFPPLNQLLAAVDLLRWPAGSGQE